MTTPDELVIQLSKAVSALSVKLEAVELEQQITKIHMATMTGLIVDALPDRIERMIAILRAAEQEAEDALHIEAFAILRHSLEHASTGQGKTQTGNNDKTAPPSWLKGVIEGKKGKGPPPPED